MTDIWAGSGGGGSGGGDAYDQIDRRVEQTASLQQHMQMNNRLTLLNRYLPGFTDDPTIATELAGSTLDDDAMIESAVSTAGESYMEDTVGWLNDMGEGFAQSYWAQLPGPLQGSLRNYGYTPPDERGGGGGWFSNIRVPLTGRIERGVNAVTRQIPGVESGPFDGSNLEIGTEMLGPFADVARVGIAGALLPARVAGNAIEQVLNVGDAGYAFATHVYRTGVIAGDRNSFVGYDDNGNPIYDTTLTEMGNVTNNVAMADDGSFFGGVASGLIDGGLWDAWGSTGDGEETFLSQDIFEARTILQGEDGDLDKQGTDLWIARKLAGGHDPSEIVDAMGIGRDDPRYQEAALNIYQKMGDEKIQAAVETLSQGKVSYGREAARAQGLDPNKGIGTVVSGVGDATFMVVLDPLNLVGGGIVKARKLTRWRLTSMSAQGANEIHAYREISEFVRMADKGESATNVRAHLNAFRRRDGGQFFSLDRLRTGSDIRQARRTNAHVDRIVEGFKRIDEASAADHGAAVGRFLDENPKLSGSFQDMLESHNAAKTTGGAGLSEVDGVWAHMADEAGRRGIMETSLGGRRADIKEIPQFGAVDHLGAIAKSRWREFTDASADVGALRRLGQMATGKLDGARELKFVEDWAITVSKIEDAKAVGVNTGVDGSLTVTRRSLRQRAANRLPWRQTERTADGKRVKGRRVQVLIDGEFHADVDELLNWTIDSGAGSARRFARSLFEHQPRSDRMSLTGPEAIEEFRRFTSAGALSHLSRRTIEDYVGRFAVGTEAERALIVETFVGDIFFRSGLGAYADNAGESLWRRYVGKQRQSYSIFERDEFVNQGVRTKGALFTKQHDDVIMIPNFKEMAKATRKMNTHRTMFGFVNPNWADSFVTRVWSPVQLLRIGFIPRAAGEEILAFMLRRNPMEFVKSSAVDSAAGLRRNRRMAQAGEAPFIDTTKNHELTVLRPLNWALNQITEWNGIRGERFDFKATVRARGHTDWGKWDETRRQQHLEEVADQILDEKKWSTRIAGLDDWVQSRSLHAGGRLHSLARSVKIPSKQRIAEAIVKQGSQPLEGAIAKRFGTDADLSIGVFKMMATDPVMSRQLTQYVGHMYEPWLNRSDDLHLGNKTPTGREIGPSTPRMIPMQVDVSEFKHYDRVQDGEAFFTNYSSILRRFLEDPEAQPAIAVLNRYVSDGVQRRINVALADAPLSRLEEVRPAPGTTRQVDNTDERMLELADEIDEIEGRLVDAQMSREYFTEKYPDDVDRPSLTPEALSKADEYDQRIMEYEDRLHALEREQFELDMAKELRDNYDYQPELKPEPQIEAQQIAIRESDLRNQKRLLEEEQAEIERLGDAEWAAINNDDPRLAESEIGSALDEIETELDELRARDEEIRAVDDNWHWEEPEDPREIELSQQIDDARSRRDRARESRHSIDDDPTNWEVVPDPADLEIARIEEEMNRLQEQRSRLDSGERSFKSVLDDRPRMERVAPSKPVDRLETAREEWRKLPPEKIEQITKYIDGDIDYRTAIGEHGDGVFLEQDSFARWIVDNHDTINHREWVAITDVTGTPILSKEALRGEMRAAVETAARNDPERLTQSMQAALDPGGHIATAPKPGTQFNYVPMIDRRSAVDLQQIAMNPQLRVSMRDEVIRRLEEIGYQPADARGIGQAVYNSIDVDVIDDLINVGINRATRSSSDMIPMSYFSHTDSRVSKVITDTFSDTAKKVDSADPRPSLIGKPSVGQIEMPKKFNPENVDGEMIDMELGLTKWGSGRIVREDWLMRATDIDPTTARRLSVIEGQVDGETLQRVVSKFDEIPEGWTKVDEIYTDGTPMDDAIRQLAHAQVEEILDTLTTFRRGNDEVLLEMTAPIARRDMSKLTAQQIMERGNMEELPQHVYGPTVIKPEDLSRKNIWDAMISGGFDDIISPAIGSLARSPHFHSNMVKSAKRMYGLQETNGPSRELLDAVAEMGVADEMFDDVVETLWDLKAGEGFAMNIDDSDRGWRLTQALRGDKADDALAAKILSEEYGIRFDDVTDPYTTWADDPGLRRIKNYLQGRRNGYNTYRDGVMREAMTLTTPFIDDHRVRSQFQTHVGAIMPFWFAEEAFLKRWARGFYENPTMLRKGQMTMQGFRNMGWIQKDQYDNDVFVWPGSEMVNNIIAKPIGAVFGEPAAQVISQPFSTDLDFLTPGVNESYWQGGIGLTEQDGYQMQFGPGFAFGLNFATDRLPELAPLRDQLLGDMSASRWDPGTSDATALWRHFVPSMYANAFQGITGLDMGSIASGQVQAMQYLAGQGIYPDENASPSEMEEYLHQVRNATRILLVTRAVTGSMTGATASPLWDIDPKSAYQQMLDDGIEYQDAMDMIIENYGPDATAFTIFGSKAGVSGAPTPYTEESLGFMQENRRTLTDFAYAAPWFIPQDVADGPYGILERRARNEALVQELRVRREPEEWLESFYERQAAPTYWEEHNEWQAVSLAARARGENTDEIDAIWKQRKNAFFAMHPVFAESMTTPKGVEKRARIIEEARFITANPAMIPESAHRDVMLTMMGELVAYEDAFSSMRYNRTDLAKENRDSIRRQFYIWATNYAEANPEVKDFVATVVLPHIGLNEIAEMKANV